ncbi:MAG: hypothetical protein GF317_15845 [Candidatus Lokiarchaeota archaeon]|nr:hypothetical protein [Candidatus Lokiarchaeota archaeon]MBD3201023.1 hypothetical protein [Candidatus Lokiarchaeota archaeon]
MVEVYPNFLENFGRIHFAEENNLCITDFENSLSKFFQERRKIHGKYKFAEIENASVNEFDNSFQKYFSE